MTGVVQRAEVQREYAKVGGCAPRVGMGKEVSGFVGFVIGLGLKSCISRSQECRYGVLLFLRRVAFLERGGNSVVPYSGIALTSYHVPPGWNVFLSAEYHSDKEHVTFDHFISIHLWTQKRGYG